MGNKAIIQERTFVVKKKRENFPNFNSMIKSKRMTCRDGI